jgi:glutathione synthase/RimK-type ligase-like ATP-grasp enzyme
MFKIMRNRVSNSAALLAGELRCQRNPIRGGEVVSWFVGGDNVRVVINWGNTTTFPNRHQKRILNQPANIVIASNKRATLIALQAAGVRVPHFASTPEEWNALPKRRNIWVARTILNGSGGAGIVIVREDDSFPENTRLVTQYIKKLQEFRVHVMNGQVLCIQQKRKESEAEQTADQKLIRNRDNGWVFARNDIDPLPEDAARQAINAVAALGLDFGAVDLVVGRDDGLAYILEVNTAPGLEGTTVTDYANGFRQHYGST